MTTQTAMNGPAIRELKDFEIDAVNGGFVEIWVYAAASTYLYIQWCKANGKI